MTKVRKSFTVIILLIAMLFSVIVSVLKVGTTEVRASAGKVSLLCDFDNCTKKSGNVYASVSNGNSAYVYALLEDVGNEGVTIYYHTVSGSAVAGVDYTEVQNGSVYSKNGTNTREVRIGIETQTCDVAITGYNGLAYLSRSFSVVIDRAVFDDGTELTVGNSTYSKNGKTFDTTASAEVMLKGNTKVPYDTASGKFTAYTKELFKWDHFDDIECEEGVWTTAFTQSTPDMELMAQVKKLGLADYYVRGEVWLSEAQDSSEEITDYYIGNERYGQTSWYAGHNKDSGCFISAGIKYNRNTIYGDAIRAIVNYDNGTDKNSYKDYVSAAVVYNRNYVSYGDTYWFLNTESPACASYTYRRYECDGDIDIDMRLYERCFDATLPQVKNLYLDTTSLYPVNGKYRLAVRFTEPVHGVSGTRIMGETNTDTSLQFDYVGGDGTDTVYYDCDTTQYENVNIKRVVFNNSISTISASSSSCYLGFRDIADFGGNKLDSIGLGSQTFNITLDKRIPTIEVEQNHISSVKPNRSPVVPLTLEKFTEGTVYYEWVKEEELGTYLSGLTFDGVHDYTSGDGVLSVINKMKANAVNDAKPLAGRFSLSNTGQDSSIKTQITFDSTTVSGNYYLLSYVEPTFNIASEDNMRLYKYGTYLVDNTKPTFDNLLESTNILPGGGFNRGITFDVFDTNGVEQVTALIRESDKPGAKVNRANLSVSDSGTVNYTLDLENLINAYYTNSDGIVTVNPGAGYYDIDFEIKDRAGNTTYVYNNSYKTFFLSINPYFVATMELVPTAEITDSLDTNIYRKGSRIKGYADEVSLKTETISVSVNGEAYVSTETETDQYHVIPVNDGGNLSIDVIFKSAGYYEIKYQVSGSYSDTFAFYVTDNFKEETETYKKAYSDELLLVNKVVQLNESVQYVYINSNRQIVREYYGGAFNPSFSSDAACLNFLKFYEYQDLKYEVLTTNTASYLNTGSDEGYNKAVGETKTAMSGQVWLRYKRSSWDVRSESINDWAYYFYAETDDGSNTIDVEKISTNLKNTINGICQKICSKIGKNANASDVYLVDDEHLDPKTRAPHLSESQIALSRPSRVDETRSGNVLHNAIYSGDPNLFENTVRMKLNGINYDLPIATNMKINVLGATKLYIAPYSDSTLSFVELKQKGEMTLRDAINSLNPTSSVCSSGVYVIRELDETGCSKFYVYVDADAPKLGIKLNDSDTVEYIDSKEVANLFARKLYLAGIGDGYDNGSLTYTEIDKSAYVALFKMPGQSLYAIYYRGEIPNERVEEGNYLVHIGDRSGNFYAFKIYVTDSKPKVEFRAYETKFTVRITNREADELQSLEVYCNEVLLSSKLLTSQTFTQNGTYRVVIKDKYSTTEYEETQEYTREYPDIDFYYDENDDGFFTKYKEGVNDFMAIQNEESYKLVSTSKRLKIKIGSNDFDFEIKGLLPADYYHNVDANEIEIRKLAPFYLDVWNREQTEDILSFKIIVDNYAPNIQVKADDRKIVYDETLSSAYSSSNKTNPSSIKFVTSNDVIEIPVLQDDKIANDYVNVTVKDDTGVREVRVYQKGELVKTYSQAEIASDGSITFFIGNVIGDVKIVAVDLFSNATSFVFSFNDKKLSDATVDKETVLPQTDSVYYGNDSATINVAARAQLHLLYYYNGNRINQIFKYENKELYLGEYKTSGSKYGIVDFYNGGMKTYDDSGNEQYKDKPVTLDRNYTYQPFVGLELYIICDPVSGRMQVDFLATDKAQRLCARVNQGNTFAEYYEIELSKEGAKLEFSSSVGSVVTSNDYVYSGTDRVDVFYDTKKITEIKVAYNKITDSFKEEDYIYTISNMFKNGEGYEEMKNSSLTKAGYEKKLREYTRKEKIADSIELKLPDNEEYQDDDDELEAEEEMPAKEQIEIEEAGTLNKQVKATAKVNAEPTKVVEKQNVK